MKSSKETLKDEHNIEIWDKVKDRLRKELGETLYKSWLKPLKLKMKPKIKLNIFRKVVSLQIFNTH